MFCLKFSLFIRFGGGIPSFSAKPFVGKFSFAKLFSIAAKDSVSENQKRLSALLIPPGSAQGFQLACVNKSVIDVQI